MGREVAPELVALGRSKVHHSHTFEAQHERNRVVLRTLLSFDLLLLKSFDPLQLLVIKVRVDLRGKGWGVGSMSSFDVLTNDIGIFFHEPYPTCSRLSRSATFALCSISFTRLCSRSCASALASHSSSCLATRLTRSSSRLSMSGGWRTCVNVSTFDIMRELRT